VGSLLLPLPLPLLVFLLSLCLSAKSKSVLEDPGFEARPGQTLQSDHVILILFLLSYLLCAGHPSEHFYPHDLSVQWASMPGHLVSTVSWRKGWAEMGLHQASDSISWMRAIIVAVTPDRAVEATHLFSHFLESLQLPEYTW